MNPQIGVNMNNIQTHRLGTYLLETVTNGCSFPIQLLAMCCDFSGYNIVCSKKKPKVWNTETISNWILQAGTSQLKLEVLYVVDGCRIVCHLPKNSWGQSW